MMKEDSLIRLQMTQWMVTEQVLMVRTILQQTRMIVTRLHSLSVQTWYVILK